MIKEALLALGLTGMLSYCPSPVKNTCLKYEVEFYDDGQNFHRSFVNGEKICDQYAENFDSCSSRRADYFYTAEEKCPEGYVFREGR